MVVKSKKDYDVKEASWKFIFLKIFEISAVLMFLFGFYYIGVYANNTLSEMSCSFNIGLDIPCPHTDNPTAFNLWWVGVSFCFLILFTLILWAIVIGLIAGILWIIIHYNWKWAKHWARNYECREKEAIEKEKKLRNRWGVLEGDMIVIKQNLKISQKYGNIKFVKRMKPFEGEPGRVIKLDTEDHTYRITSDSQQFWWTVPMLKITQKRENPFLKKLEEDPWKKKK